MRPRRFGAPHQIVRERGQSSCMPDSGHGHARRRAFFGAARFLAGFAAGGARPWGLRRAVLFGLAFGFSAFFSAFAGIDAPLGERGQLLRRSPSLR